MESLRADPAYKILSVLQERELYTSQIASRASLSKRHLLRTLPMLVVDGLVTARKDADHYKTFYAMTEKGRLIYRTLSDPDFMLKEERRRLPTGKAPPVILAAQGVTQEVVVPVPTGSGMMWQIIRGTPPPQAVSLARQASGTNTLLVLPTGQGKTMLTVLVAAERLSHYPAGKILVVAPTKPLVREHYQTFKEYVAMPPQEFVVITSTQSTAKREEMWQDGRIIFTTPQTAYNGIRRRRFSVEDVVLVVLDEAHRSVKDYTYGQLVKLYKNRAKHPLILGLTSATGGPRSRLADIKRNLSIEKEELEAGDIREFMD